MILCTFSELQETLPSEGVLEVGVAAALHDPRVEDVVALVRDPVADKHLAHQRHEDDVLLAELRHDGRQRVHRRFA